MFLPFTVLLTPFGEKNSYKIILNIKYYFGNVEFICVALGLTLSPESMEAVIILFLCHCAHK